MKSIQKARKLFLLVETADEIHSHHSASSEESGDAWKSAKEQVAYDNIQCDIFNARRALKHWAHHRVSLARWLAVTIATLSVEEYIRKFKSV